MATALSHAIPAARSPEYDGGAVGALHEVVAPPLSDMSALYRPHLTGIYAMAFTGASHIGRGPYCREVPMTRVNQAMGTVRLGGEADGGLPPPTRTWHSYVLGFASGALWEQRCSPGPDQLIVSDRVPHERIARCNLLGILASGRYWGDNAFA